MTVCADGKADSPFGFAQGRLFGNDNKKGKNKSAAGAALF